MSAPPPLHGMQLGAPPLKIIHLKRVLLGTSSSVQDVPSLPLRQHSSRVIPGMYSTWHLPFFPCCSQQFPAAKDNSLLTGISHFELLTTDPDAPDTHTRRPHYPRRALPPLSPSRRYFVWFFLFPLFLARQLTLAYSNCDWQPLQCSHEPQKSENILLRGW